MTDELVPAGLRPRRRADVIMGQRTSELSIPKQNPKVLPFHELSAAEFESLVAEIVSRRDNLGVYFYGRPGQKQYGLDIVERETTGSTCLYQVKKYTTIKPSELRAIVREYAGAPSPSGPATSARPFAPRRFVVVVAASIGDDTKTVEMVYKLQEEYADDLLIEVWGADTLGQKLRDAPHLVYATFGPHWAEAWCAFTPQSTDQVAPSSWALIDGPIEVLNLGAKLGDADFAEANSDPATAAQLFGSIARDLDGSGFPGHAMLMQRRQAHALQVAGDAQKAFAIRCDLAVQQALSSEASTYRPEHDELAEMEQTLTPAQQTKIALITCIANWSDAGTDLAIAVPALRQLVDDEDPHAAALCCRVLEQALVDGLFDFAPPHSIVVEVNDETPALLAELQDVCLAADTPEVVLRARLRCAIADARLTLDASTSDIDEAYGELTSEAAAGRFREAQSLITSRAAYAHAVRGSHARAINLWRQSILASSTQGHYEDVRLAARSARCLAFDCGEEDPRNWDVQRIVQALPNQDRLLNDRLDPTLIAYAAAQSGKATDSFGASRQYLFSTRVGGHLQEHQLALALFGDVLAAASRPADAVWCYTAAGKDKKATQLAREVPKRVDLCAWLGSRMRRCQATAVQVTAAQAQVTPDSEVDSTVSTLLNIAKQPWRTSHPSPSPSIEAVEAISVFGVRIPESALDAILDIAGPMIAGDRSQPFELAALLVNAYYAVPTRHADLGRAIVTLLERPQPIHDLWRLITQLPATACEPLLPAVTAMAENDHYFALHALARWTPEAPVVQRTARLTCAVLLRKACGHERSKVVFGTQERDTVRLLVCLLNTAQPIEFPSSICMGSEPVPVGITYLTRSTSDDDQKPDEPVETGTGAADEAALIAVGPPEALAIAIAWKLMVLAEDHHDAAASRASVVDALRMLVEHLPPATAASLAPRLLSLYEQPNLSVTDIAEIESDHPLSRSVFRTGADRLAPRALAAAADAFAAGRDTTVEMSTDERALAERIAAAATKLLWIDHLAVLGAIAYRALGRASDAFAHRAAGLLLHSNENVRALGVGCPQVTAAEFGCYASDPSPEVRAAVARRAAELPVDLRSVLANDNNSVVRRCLRLSLDQ